MPGALPLPAQPAAHDNGFGILRLTFALLVLVSHAPEMIDGNRSREILTQVFGSLSFGEFAVDGFFVISGALITASWLNAASWRDYLWRRVVRIYPGFLVAYAVSVLVVASLGGGTWPGLAEIGPRILDALRLHGPGAAGGAFLGQPVPDLNGAMWSISHEFNCYLMIAALGLLGLLRWRWVILALALFAAVQSVRHYFPPPVWDASAVVSAPEAAPVLSWGRFLWLEVKGQFWPYWRLVMLFLAGSLYHLWRREIPWRGDWAVVALVGLVCGLLLPTPLAEIGFALFGGYLIFYLAQAARGSFWARVNAKNDISYGIYLYGWPIQKLVWWYFPTAPLGLAFGATLVLAVAMGWASWLCVERPALRWARRRG